MNHPIRSWAKGQAIMRASPQVREMIEVGREHRWRFQPMGRAHVPTKPVYARDWVVVPIDEDTSQIPDVSLERVRALFEAGVRPKAFVIAHETPRVLAAPPGSARVPAQPAIDWPKLREDAAQRAKKLAERLPDLEVVGPVLLQGAKVVGIAVAVMVAVPLLLVGAVGALALADPVLIAVTEDDYWVEIDRWYA